MTRIMEDISKWTVDERRSKLEKIYKEKIGVDLNLEAPVRFTEKTQWRKLYENDPRITECINKLTFKHYIEENLGKGYTVPLIGVWDCPESVDLSSIPEKCVIKSNCSGDGHFTLLIGDKYKLNFKAIEEDIKEKWFDRRLLHTNSFFRAYYSVVPCVIIEQLVGDGLHGANEYKFLCFNGEPRYIYHSSNHFKGLERVECSVSFFSLGWENIGIQYGIHENNKTAPKPIHLEEMKKVSRILSKDFSFVRVDFFETSEKFYVSEMTFTQGSGLTPFFPDEFDFELGKLWNVMGRNQ